VIIDSDLGLHLPPENIHLVGRRMLGLVLIDEINNRAGHAKFPSFGIKHPESGIVPFEMASRNSWAVHYDFERSPSPPSSGLF
jgi:hypothetical protein